MADFSFLTGADPEDEEEFDDSELDIETQFDDLDPIPALDPSTWLEGIPQVELIDLIDPNLLKGIASLYSADLLTEYEARKILSRWLPIEVA